MLKKKKKKKKKKRNKTDTNLYHLWLCRDRGIKVAAENRVHTKPANDQVAMVLYGNHTTGQYDSKKSRHGSFSDFEAYAS